MSYMYHRDISHIKEHASYHGSMGPNDAATKLKEDASDTNRYITRQYWGDYMISVRDAKSNEVQHFRIKKTEVGQKKYQFRVRGANDDELFDNVPSLLEYYKDRPVYREAAMLGECLKRGALVRQSKLMLRHEIK